MILTKLDHITLEKIAERYERRAIWQPDPVGCRDCDAPSGNGGAAPQALDGMTNDLYGVWGTSAENLYAVGAGALVVRFDGMDWGVEYGTLDADTDMDTDMDTDELQFGEIAGDGVEQNRLTDGAARQFG